MHKEINNSPMRQLTDNYQRIFSPTVSHQSNKTAATDHARIMFIEIHQIVAKTKDGVAGERVSDAIERSSLATWPPSKSSLRCDAKNDTLLDLCVSSLRRGHANLLCIVPILTDDPRRESK